MTQDIFYLIPCETIPPNSTSDQQSEIQENKDYRPWHSNPPASGKKWIERLWEHLRGLKYTELGACGLNDNKADILISIISLWSISLTLHQDFWISALLTFWPPKNYSVAVLCVAGRSAVSSGTYPLNASQDHQSMTHRRCKVLKRQKCIQLSRIA